MKINFPSIGDDMNLQDRVLASVSLTLTFEDGNSHTVPLFRHFEHAEKLNFTNQPEFESFESFEGIRIGTILKSEKFIIEVDYGEGVIP